MAVVLALFGLAVCHQSCQTYTLFLQTKALTFPQKLTLIVQNFHLKRSNPMFSSSPSKNILAVNIVWVSLKDICQLLNDKDTVLCLCVFFCDGAARWPQRTISSTNLFLQNLPCFTPSLFAPIPIKWLTRSQHGRSGASKEAHIALG